MQSRSEKVQLRGRCELAKLVAVLLTPIGLAHVALGGQLGFFEVAENFARAFEDGFWDSGEACYLNAVALVGTAVDNFAKENDLIAPFSHSDVEIAKARQPAGEFDELVIVCGEERARADLVVQVLEDGPGEA